MSCNIPAVSHMLCHFPFIPGKCNNFFFQIWHWKSSVMLISSSSVSRSDCLSLSQLFVMLSRRTVSCTMIISFVLPFPLICKLFESAHFIWKDAIRVSSWLLDSCYSHYINIITRWGRLLGLFGEAFLFSFPLCILHFAKLLHIFLRYYKLDVIFCMLFCLFSMLEYLQDIHFVGSWSRCCYG